MDQTGNLIFPIQIDLKLFGLVCGKNNEGNSEIEYIFYGGKN